MYDYKTLQQGSWEARTLIRDNKANTSYIVNLSIYAVKSDKLRVDMLDTFGNHVGSFLLEKDKLTILDPKNKRAYKGRANSRTLKKLISVPMDPRIFYTFLFEQPPAKAQWKCEYEEELISKCKNARNRLKFAVSSRSAAKKKVKFEHASGYLQMNFIDYSSSIDSPEKKFKMKIPSSFKVIKI